MISSTDEQLRIRQGLVHNLKRFNHELKPFVGSPFSESQDAMFGIATPGEIRIFRFACQNPVGANVYIVVAVFFLEDLAIPRHKYRHRI
jgi:hypothetical protein